MKIRLNLSEEQFNRDYVKFLALVTPFAGIATSFGAVTILEPLAPLLLWFTLKAARRLPAFGHAYLLYCAISALSAAVVFVDEGAGMAVRTFVAALRQFLIFAPFVLLFGIRSFDIQLAREINDRFLIGCGIAVYLGMTLHFMGFQLSDNQSKLWIEGQDVVLRAGGLVGNSGAFGLQIALWCTSFFLIRPALRQVTPLWMTAAVLIGAALGLYYSASRGGFVQLMGALVIGLIFSSAIRLKLGALIGGGIAALFVIWNVITGGIQIDTGSAAFTQLARLDVFNLTGMNEFSDSGRSQLFLYFLGIMSENLALGIGYKMTIPKFGQPLDNAFLLAFFETGVIAGVLFTVFWIALLAVLLRRSLTESWFAPIGFAIAAAFMVRLMVMGANTAWNAAPGFFIMAAMMLRLSADRKRLLTAQEDDRRAALAARRDDGYRGGYAPAE